MERNFLQIIRSAKMGAVCQLSDPNFDYSEVLNNS